MVDNFRIHRETPKSLSVITYGELVYDARIDDMDILIASTALTHNLVLVTNNEKHFRRVPGLEIENWTS